MRRNPAKGFLSLGRAAGGDPVLCMDRVAFRTPLLGQRAEAGQQWLARQVAGGGLLAEAAGQTQN